MAWWEVHRRYGAGHQVRPSAVRIEWVEARRWRPELGIRFTLRPRAGAPPLVSSVWWPFAPAPAPAP